MNELMILNEENKEVKSYAIYYTINERFYTIYTSKEKDENNYVILHIAKVLKEVNNTPEGIVPTGKYIGLEISDQSEWDNAKVNIGEIVANKQNNTPTSVSYLPVSEINGISIKSSKTFKLREDVVDSIIVNNAEEALPMEVEVAPVVEETLPAVETPIEPAIEETLPAAETPLESISTDVVAPNPFEMQPEVETVVPTIEETAPVTDEVTPVVEETTSIETDSFTSPTIAPNPFEMQPEVEIPAPVEEEPKINPYEVMQQQRAEEMVNELANDNMQDIVASPVIPVSELETKAEEITPVTEEPIVPAVESIEPVVEATAPVVETTEPVVENGAEPEAEAPVEPTVEEKEVISSESFVDSIVADVSDILDKKEETSPEEKEDYERLYNDALEKTVELEKELAELHSKLNNIKNIIE